MHSARYVLSALCAALVCILTFGCANDYDDVLLEEPGVLTEQTDYWVGDVTVNQRQTVVQGYDTYTHEFRGSVKNLGTTPVAGARFVIISYDLRYELDGTPVRQDEEIAAIQDMGTLAAQQELPINLSYTYSSFHNREIVGRFEAGSS